MIQLLMLNSVHSMIKPLITCRLVTRLVSIGAALIFQTACVGGRSQETHSEVKSYSGVISLPKEGTWTTRTESSATVIVRERLFGIWKSTSLTSPVAGWAAFSDGALTGMFSSNLSKLTSDDDRRDDYLRSNLFRDTSRSEMQCSVIDQMYPRSAFAIGQILKSRCNIGNFSTDQTWSLISATKSEPRRITLQSDIDMGLYGIPDISQEPIVKVSRIASVTLSLVFHKD
jgi:hypothetical protein